MILIKNYRGQLTVVLGALFGRTGIWPEGFYLWASCNRQWEGTEVEVPPQKELKTLYSTVAFPESSSDLPWAAAVYSQGTGSFRMLWGLENSVGLFHSDVWVTFTNLFFFPMLPPGRKSSGRQTPAFCSKWWKFWIPLPCPDEDVPVSTNGAWVWGWSVSPGPCLLQELFLQHILCPDWSRFWN